MYDIFAKIMLLIKLHPLKNVYVYFFLQNQILPLFWNVQYFIIPDTFTQKTHNSLLSHV